ncbi:universal stress protein [Aestuariivivens sediminis]|uniref:universal stress protein n=1 Tax=Aestuariivivens sediminis TaxID=2913557 RepID=UPI001F57F18A|nr:universal stress protein [Aestuariivivens sediminis]
MRKILILTDFSDHAFNYAADLFKYEICSFYIMHAYQDDSDAPEINSEETNLETILTDTATIAKKKLEKTIKSVTSTSPNPRHSYHLISTNHSLLEEVDHLVEEQNIDIIVMGAKEQSHHKNITFGSHTPQVIKYVKCPVLVIPEQCDYNKPKHILFPTHYLIPYKRRELKLFCEIANSYRAVIDVLYNAKSEKLSAHQKDNQRFLNEELGKNEIHFKTSSNQNITDAIRSYIKHNEIDMLVIVNSNHLTYEDIIFKTTLDEIILNLDIPYLILQNRET